MGKLGDRFGRIDDSTKIYDARTRQFSGKWLVLSWLGGSVLVAVVMGVAAAFGVDETAAWIAICVLLLVFFIWYIPWRRARNKRLTGSPTQWP